MEDRRTRLPLSQGRLRGPVGDRDEASREALGGYRRAGLERAASSGGNRVPALGSERMKNSYLEVTFRHGRPLAAYLYVARQPADKSYRTAKAEPGLVIDFNR